MVVNGYRKKETWLSPFKKAPYTSYKGRKQAFFFLFLTPLITRILDFITTSILPSNMIYTNTPFKVGYLPNRLIDLKQLAHMESTSSLAVLISCSACFCILKKKGGGWSRREVALTVTLFSCVQGKRKDCTKSKSRLETRFHHPVCLVAFHCFCFSHHSLGKL